MERIRNILIDIALVVASVVAAFYIMQVADFVAGLFPPETRWPGAQGLLFPPNTEHNWDMHDYKIKETVNALGFRDREDVTVEKKCAYRVIAIGDSFTYGWGVNLEDTWIKRLEGYLRQQGLDVEVLNLGKPATGPNEYAQMAAQIIPILKPDLVILGILNGDDPQQTIPDFLHLFMNLRSRINRWKAGPVPQTPQPPVKKDFEECHQIEIGYAKGILDNMKGPQREHFDKLEPAVKQAFLDGRLNPWLIEQSTREPDYFLRTIDLKKMRLYTYCMGRKFKQIRKIADKYHAGVIAFSLPEGFYVNKEAYKNIQRIGFEAVPEMQTSTVPDEQIETACKKAHIPFYSVLKGFREHAEDPVLYLEFDRHMAPAGHELFAKTITPIVARQIGNAAKGASPVRN